MDEIIKIIKMINTSHIGMIISILVGCYLVAKVFCYIGKLIKIARVVISKVKNRDLNDSIDDILEKVEEEMDHEKTDN